MVPIRRSSVYHRLGMHGIAHGTGYRLPLFRTVTKKISPIAHMGGDDVFLRRHFPVVFLGLFACFQHNSNEWLYR